MDGVSEELEIKMILVVVWFGFSLIFWCAIMSRIQRIWKEINTYLRGFKTQGPQYICAAHLAILSLIKYISNLAMGTPVALFLWLIFDMMNELSGELAMSSESANINSFSVDKAQFATFVVSIAVLMTLFFYLWSLEMLKQGRVASDEG